MREILFRGKRIDNGEWVYGFFCNENCETPFGPLCEQANIIKKGTGFWFEVDPKTVGQYTGLTDKNGKKIFEGDIVHAVYKSNYIGAPDTDFGTGIIEYCGSYYGGAAYRINTIGAEGSRVFSHSLEVKVVGNIHDNPELLEAMDNDD